MYVIGKGHDHEGPGTSLVQRINWTTGQEAEMRAGFGAGMAGIGSNVAEFYSDCRTMSPGCSEKGLGCACGGKCKTGCGLGLFDNGFDPSTFGALEWGIVALGGYMVASTVFATGRGVRAVSRIPGERRKRKAAKYRALASELSRKK